MPDTDNKPHAYQGRLVFCANCGTPIPEGSAIEDEGEYKSEEEGKIFLYCSVECRESH